jgi:tRNA nucleotidyltransferase (CCA-adding enzyme)
VLEDIAKAIRKENGRVFYVGGYVRDNLLGCTSKDIDVEVYNICPQRLLEILSRFGRVDVMGKSFGIIRVNGLGVDFAMPRRERKVAAGHKGFEIGIDPFMSYEEACRRRDFTMNAILKDVLTGEIIDPFSGTIDIRNKVIRHIDDATFIEDPLRVYRAVQFTGRLGFSISSETIKLCSGIDLSSISRERVFDELLKLLLLSEKPSVGFEYMLEMGVIKKYFPLLYDLVGCPQSEIHHPEGDAWNHTMLVIDEAAKLREKSKSPDSFMLAALLHDIGKPATTKKKDGKIISHGHAEVGEKLAFELLCKLTNDKRIIADTTNLVKNHMKPISLYQPRTKDSAIRRFASKCDIHEVLLLHEADYKGRAGDIDGFEKIKEWFQEKIVSLSLERKIEPLVKGRDLIRLGLEPGVHFGKILRQAFEMQLDGLKYEDIMASIKKTYL